jgi:hypothetical protein
MAIMQTLRIDRDTQRQIIWFSGTLADGHKFSVGFPIAHVVVTFDGQSSSMGSPYSVCAGIPNIDGFFSGIANQLATGGQVAQVARTAQSNTLQSLGKQAQHYATHAAAILRGSPALRSPASHAAPAVSAQGLAAWHAAHIVSTHMKSGKNVSRYKSIVLGMVANPQPQAQLALAGLQSYRPR